MGIWPRFRSPLIWDVFAVSTYGTVSALFWYWASSPTSRRCRIVRRTSTSGGCSARSRSAGGDRPGHWALRDRLLLAGMSTPLVLSVHRRELRLLDRHRARLAPRPIFTLFVAGAVTAGFAMVLTLAIPLRKWCGMEDFITMRHIENMAKVMLVTGLIVFYGYLIEAFFGWYSANECEKYMIVNRMTGPYGRTGPDLLQRPDAADDVVEEAAHQPHLALHPLADRQRRDVAGALRDHRDVAAPRLPAVVVGHVLYPTFWDFSTFFGTIGLFTTLMFLFVQLLPMISIFEVAHARAGSEGQAEARSHR